MYACEGDHIVVRGHHYDEPTREAEVLDVEHEDGRPPYQVRWIDTGDEELLFPAPEAFVEHEGPEYPPEYEPQLVCV
ncbi:MAG: DUF1918 domain-containing protein [Nocardioides sp.]|nr:DUF1918 domain-containing protein [Nocardioides sp.]